MGAGHDKAERFGMTPGHWRALEKSAQGYKHRHGHVAVVSGPAGQGGAARLAARGALRIGAGLVSVVCAPAAVAEHAAHLNAIMIKPCPQEEGLATHLQNIRATSLCIGPNLGLNGQSRLLLTQALNTGLPACVDADAITLLPDPALARPLVSHPQSVMTPHEGELRRFIPEVFAKTGCRVTLTREASRKAGCVVLFKGPETVVADPAGRMIIVSSRPYKHASWLATAGSGDVLAGFISGLLARGFCGIDAATVGADLHFRCAQAFGPGLIAEDIPEMLPRVLSQI